MNHLFAYGTLMCEEIMEAVSGYRLSGVSGILDGYRRRALKGELYPAMIMQPGEEVRGMVYRDLPGPAWAPLDRYEGEMYCRKRVAIRLANGAVLESWAYVLRSDYLEYLDVSDWSFRDFLREGKALYLEMLGATP